MPNDVTLPQLVPHWLSQLTSRQSHSHASTSRPHQRAHSLKPHQFRPKWSPDTWCTLTHRTRGHGIVVQPGHDAAVRVETVGIQSDRDRAGEAGGDSDSDKGRRLSIHSLARGTYSSLYDQSSSASHRKGCQCGPSHHVDSSPGVGGSPPRGKPRVDVYETSSGKRIHEGHGLKWSTGGPAWLGM